MVLALRYENVDLTNYFGVFCKKLINYAINEIKNAEDVMMVIHDMKYPKSFFNYKNKPKDLTT